MKHFKAPSKTIGTLDARTTARLLTAAADISLVLDPSGKIKDVSFTSDTFESFGCSDWPGRRWQDLVTQESQPKITAMLNEAAGDGNPTWHQVNHPGQSGQDDLPIRYYVMPLASSKSVIAIGRDMSAESRLQRRLISTQAELERDYARITQAETRYQALFRFSTEAIVVVDANNLEIFESNNAATALFANGSRTVVGRRLPDLFADSDKATLDAVLAEARTAPRTDPVTVQSYNRSRHYRLAVSVFRDQLRLMYLIRLSDPAAPANTTKEREAAQRLFGLIQGLPDAFVVLDEERRVLSANAAFVELAQLATEDQARNQPISEWLGRVEIDTEVLFSSLDRSSAIARYKMVMRGSYGASDPVEVSAVAATHMSKQYYGLVIRRDTAPSLPLSTEAALPTAESLENLKDLVGRAPLKELVRQSTDIIERMCIEAALELTGDNRASAAEMLGLSRQSLYQKLRRHHIGARGEDE